jgi:hypothetical protein
MDQALTAFREAADRENRHRRVRRRYSPTLQQQALEYWQQRRRLEGVRAIAARLGVSVTTLQRWTRGLPGRSRFRRVAVRHPAPSEAGTVCARRCSTGTARASAFMRSDWSAGASRACGVTSRTHRSH